MRLLFPTRQPRSSHQARRSVFWPIRSHREAGKRLAPCARVAPIPGLPDQLLVLLRSRTRPWPVRWVIIAARLLGLSYVFAKVGAALYTDPRSRSTTSNCSSPVPSITSRTSSAVRSSSRSRPCLPCWHRSLLAGSCQCCRPRGDQLTAIPAPRPGTRNDGTADEIRA